MKWGWGKPFRPLPPPFWKRKFSGLKKYWWCARLAERAVEKRGGEIFRWKSTGGAGVSRSTNCTIQKQWTFLFYRQFRNRAARSDGQKIEVNKETGEVTMKFKLPVWKVPGCSNLKRVKEKTKKYKFDGGWGFRVNWFRCRQVFHSSFFCAVNRWKTVF